MTLKRLCVLGSAALSSAALGVSTLPPAVASPAPHSAAAGTTRAIRYAEWTTNAQLRSGHTVGTAVRKGAVRISTPAGRTTYADPYGKTTQRYAYGIWRSPWSKPGFGLTELIASWRARTPEGTWIKVETRGLTTTGRTGSWDSLGHWAAHDRRFHRMSLGAQRDDVTRVNVDTVAVRRGVRLAAWQLRVTLFRRSHTSLTPVLDAIGAVASNLPNKTVVARSRTGVATGMRLDVPRYSQMIHQGEYPQWDNGGEAWCSPTSTAMVLRYWRRGPAPRHYAWVNDNYRQPWVDHAARSIYDYRFAGAGNWAFNTAYAARYGLRSFVTRLRSLREAERFVKAGIPLIASISFGAGELDNAPISSSSGHLLVIAGFTAAGDVVVNDPAGPTAKGVRRVYDRAQFENAWIPKTGGTVYVIAPPGRALPASHGNW